MHDLYTGKKQSLETYLWGSLDTGLIRKNVYIIYFKYVQRTIGKHVLKVKQKYESDVSPNREYW